MAELKTVTLMNIGVVSAHKVVSYLFEEVSKIKKIVLTMALSTPNGAGEGTAWVSKYADVGDSSQPEHGERGHLAMMKCKLDMVTSGMTRSGADMVVDMGNDHVRIEADDKLYLHTYGGSLITTKAFAIVYLEE